MKRALFAVLTAFLLMGCVSTRYVPVETVRTEYITKSDTFIKHDSIMHKDSVFVQQKGDTVWLEKWHTRYVERLQEKIISDTMIQRDTIPVPYPVEKQLSFFQRMAVDWFMYSLIALAVLFIVLLYKIKKT